jgi:hypothetical protein
MPRHHDLLKGTVNLLLFILALPLAACGNNGATHDVGHHDSTAQEQDTRFSSMPALAANHPTSPDTLDLFIIPDTNGPASSADDITIEEALSYDSLAALPDLDSLASLPEPPLRNTPSLINPSTTVLRIPSPTQNGVPTLTLLDVQGRVVDRVTLPTTGGDELIIPWTALGLSARLPSGVYFLNVAIGPHHWVRRIAIQH